MSGPSNFQLFATAKLNILNGTEKLYSDTYSVMLCNAAPAFTASFTGASGFARYSDVSGYEVSGTGYTAGGANTSITIAESNGTVTVGCGGANWASATITAVYAVVYDRAAANQPLLGYVPLDPTGGTNPVSSTNGTYSATFPNGLFTL